MSRGNGAGRLGSDRALVELSADAGPQLPLLIKGSGRDHGRVCAHAASQSLSSQHRGFLNGKVRGALAQIFDVLIAELPGFQFVQDSDAFLGVQSFLPAEPPFTDLSHVIENIFPVGKSDRENPAVTLGQQRVINQGILLGCCACQYAQPAERLIGNEGVLPLGGVEQGQHLERVLQFFLIARFCQPAADADIADRLINIDIFTAVLADIRHHSQLIAVRQRGFADLQHGGAEHGLPVSQRLCDQILSAPLLRVCGVHSDINVLLDVVHGIFPCSCGGCIAGQKILLPPDPVRSREPAGLGQVENCGKRVVIEPGPHQSGRHPGFLDLAAQRLELVKISRHRPAVLLHQRLIVVDPMQGGTDRQKIDPAVHGGIFHKRRTDLIYEIKAGQVCQPFTRKRGVQDLGSDKNVRDIVSSHLSPFIAGRAGTRIGGKTETDLRISFVRQL